MANNKPATKATVSAAKHDTPPEVPPGSTTHPAGTAGIPDKPEGKGEKRLFQVNKNEKQWLSQDEAEKRGLYWNEKPHAKA